MTAAIIISLCLLLLLAYFFDVTASRTRVPSVILLLLMGWGLREASLAFDMALPDLTPVLPVLGTIGLILIVFEGSLELKVEPSKLSTIRIAFVGAALSALGMAFLAGVIVHLSGNYSLKLSIANAIPLCIISSAIAIPTAQALGGHDKEFVIYESSLSDIVGVLMFNFVIMNEVINTMAFVQFGGQLLLMAVISFAATLLLAFLLHRINHHVKFVPIILLMILVYELSKIYHLPSLLFILLFGLALGNLEGLSRFPAVHRLRWTDLSAQIPRLREITTEGAFLVRSIFFLLFGYTLETVDVINPDTMIWSAGLVGIIYLLRALQLWISRLPMAPLLFIAPRGLISILLFLSIPSAQAIPLVNKSLLTQVIVLTALIMMIGMFTSPPPLPPMGTGESPSSPFTEKDRR